MQRTGLCIRRWPADVIILLTLGLLVACGGGGSSNNDDDDDIIVFVSIAGTPSLAEGSTTDTMDFSVSLSVVTTRMVTVNIQTEDGTAIQGSDYSAIDTAINIPTGMTSADVSVELLDDTLDEDDETLTLTIVSAVGASIGTSSGIGTILDDDPAPTISIGDMSVPEGNSGGSSPMSFPVSLSQASGRDVNVDYQSSAGTASQGNDFQATSGTLTILAGTVTASVDVPIVGDLLNEADETLSISLSNAVNATIGQASATGTIVNDDGVPVVTMSNGSANEGDISGNAIVFAVTLNVATGADVSVDFTTVNGSATAGNDFAPVAGTLTIPAGQTAGSITVTTIPDTIDESDKAFTLALSSPVNATLGSANATGVVVDDDGAPALSIAAASVTEGDAGNAAMAFQVSLSNASGNPVEVDYQSADGNAVAGSDYQNTSGTLTIPAGVLIVAIDVNVIGDALDEPDETLILSLSDAVGASIAIADATGTIIDDDDAPTLSIPPASIAEGDTGTSDLIFTATLDTESGRPIAVDYATNEGTATEGTDYQAVSATLAIPAGELSVTVSVAVVGDTDDEDDEEFELTLSNPQNAILANVSATGTITDDDDGPVSGLDARPVNTSCVAPARPIGSALVASEAAYPDMPRLTRPVGLLQAPGDPSEWYVVEKDGRILRFDNDLSVDAISTFIDIREPTDPIDVDSTDGETGLLGMAFHPDYGNGNYDAFLSYTLDNTANGTRYRSVIARFESNDGGQTLDPTTATILIEFGQPFNNHNGGNILIGPDGYLYIHFGDGGSGGDPGDRAQNTSNLFGSLLRIDVDSGSPYGVPSDNPFAPNAFCNDGDGTAACPEIYAWGLRNAWRYTFDPETNVLWLADVGQNDYEEVNIVERGGNYGWRCREGRHDYDTTGVCPNGLIDPIIEYDHNVGRSITGGYVYRGAAIPELAGRYVFGDFGVGTVFASVADGNGGYSYETLLNTGHSISTFAVEPSGELLYLAYAGGTVQRIVDAGGSSTDTVPGSLLASGCVDAANPSQPSSGLVPYAINAPFWSDGAAQERWYAIPDDMTIDIAADGDWLFPNGTVLMKHFRLNGELFETRLFMRHTDGEWAGYTYEWNAAGTDAIRVIGGKTVDVQGQPWSYPSGSQCMECHTQAANFSLGLEHRQLNRDLQYPASGITANQLVTADEVDLLTTDLPGTSDALPRFAEPSDASAELEVRARAYLHSNCSGCHRPGGPTSSSMDLRHATTFAATQTCNAEPSGGDLGIAGATIITPGDADASILVQRMNRRDAHGMPPLASNFVDVEGVQLLRDWINSLAACP